MYDEFKQIALEDFDLHNYRYGVECLFRFYSYGLERRYRQDLLDDFQELCVKDYNSGNLYGLEKFRAYLIYKRTKKDIIILPALKEALDKFPTLDDFKPFKPVRSAQSSAAPSPFLHAANSQYQSQSYNGSTRPSPAPPQQIHSNDAIPPLSLSSNK